MHFEPYEGSTAKAELNRRLADGRTVFTKHFREELLADKLTVSDVLYVCRSGSIASPAEPDLRTGSWKYRIEGATQGSGPIAVVFTFRSHDVVLITVFKRSF